MRTLVSLSLGIATAACLLGCPIGHQSPPARAQEAATELNVNSRFGRLEMAVERVAPSAREGFVEHRRAWGGAIRVADYEMAGLKMKGKEDADILVKVAWYRINEGDLHITTIKQKWHDFKGDWKLVDETHAEGERGLLGEPAPPNQGAGPSGLAKKPAQFPTIRLGESRQEGAPATIPPPDSASGD